MSKSLKKFISLALFAALSGCGYSTQSLLPAHIRTVHVEPVVSTINFSSEVSDKERFRVYRPGVEVDITNAIINRFIFDGNLKSTTDPAKADAILKTKLVDYRRDPLRYTDDDEVTEYRLSIVIDATFYDAQTHKVLWHEASLTGDTTFFLSGPHALSEDEAVVKAVEDLAKRVVDRTIELW